jgi:hypothetical protein
MYHSELDWKFALYFRVYFLILIAILLDILPALNLLNGLNALRIDISISPGPPLILNLPDPPMRIGVGHNQLRKRLQHLFHTVDILLTGQ